MKTISSTTRFCILTNPRSGSLWLESLLYSSIKNLPNALMAGEICEPGMHQMLTVTDLLRLDVVSRERDDTKYSLLRSSENCIRSSDRQQPFTMRLFCNGLHETSYFSKFISFLHSHDIRVIALVRDPFECALSNTVARNTGIYHSHYSSMSIDSLNIDASNFRTFYAGALFSYSNLSKLVKCYSLPVVKYESMITDLYELEINIDPSMSLKKTYIKPYSEIIENYSELLESVRDITQRFRERNS